ncbi:carbon monoxide dehydrogenase subunit G [bacterium]|nr:carbon monoxide dehydrogenase subunit G [bacterium]
MKLEGNHTFNGSQQEIWDFIMDPDVIGKTIPGCEEMKVVGEDVYEAKMTIGIAAVKGVYTSKVTLSDKQPPDSYTLKIEGKGARGFLNGIVSVRLQAAGEQTIMYYVAENQIGGPIAAVGQRIVGAAAKMFVNQSFKSLEKQLEQRRNQD